MKKILCTEHVGWPACLPVQWSRLIMLVPLQSSLPLIMDISLDCLRFLAEHKESKQNHKTLHAWLLEHKLDEYHERLVAEGVTELDDFKEL